jgi:TPR repeat protein
MLLGKLMLLLWMMLASSLPLHSQSDRKSHPNSPVFKNYQPTTTAPLLEQSDATYQMWQGFQVMQKANAGDPVSQFELSIRYLTGRGFKADTSKAVYWTKRAADQNHLLARFNLAIFEFNGWGTDWNPFNSYRDFRYAAERNLPEAQHALAQFLTENLVLSRNREEAYRWLKLAADSGYAPAKETLKEFERRGYRPASDSADAEAPTKQSAGQRSALQFQFLNFTTDTTKAPSDTVLLEDAVRAAIMSKDQEIQRIFGSINTGASGFELDSTAFLVLKRSAETGSPEALALVGWCYERGVRVRKDIIVAAMYYVRGVRLDSPRASRLLYDLIQTREFFEALRQYVHRNDPDAMYVWACLVAFGFDRQLTDAQALQMLERAAARDHVQAQIELGLCYYAGRWTKRDEQKAETFWRRAAEAGSNEAAVRLAVRIIRGEWGDRDAAIDVLQQAVRNGSVLAEVALGYCFEMGVGVDRNWAEAARLYRNGAQRGSQDAFFALRRMHDNIRPQEKEFQLAD